jgi:hypothetical protein
MVLPSLSRQSMKTKNTWIVVALAAGLFAFIFFFERHASKREIPTNKVLPHLNAASLTSVQVRPAGQLEIRADRTNGGWQLTKPVAFPAQSANIEGLLEALEQLTSQTPITPQELKQRSKTDAVFGFDTPQFSLTLQQGDARRQILIGLLTALRDQVFLRVVGDDKIYLVDANLLKLLPRQANNWRNTAFISLKGLTFDRLAVTSGTRFFELQREATNKVWRMTQPMKARADNPKIDDLLQKMQSLRASKFVTDEPQADLASFGLQPAELELVIGQGTNDLLSLQFGRSPTNDPSVVYARQRNQKSIVLIAKEQLGSLVTKDQLNTWRVDHEDFQDRYLISSTAGTVGTIQARGDARFAVQRQTNDTWRVIEPENFAADTGLVRDLLAGLTGLQVAEFTKGVVTELGLTNFGLASPARQYILRNSDTNNPGATTNPVVAQLDFGAVSNNLIYVRRADENSVSAVKLGDYQRLPKAGWQLRDRRIWSFTTNDVIRVTIRQDGKTRQINRDGANNWSLAPGSQGSINDFAIEETIHRLGDLVAAYWVDRSDQNRKHYGFSDDSYQLTIEIRKGDKPQTLNLEFGGMAPSQFPYAAVTLDGQRYTFEFPWGTYQLILRHLTIPAP